MLTKSVVDDIGFFEGTEKLLEIWFSGDSSATDEENKCDLRDIPRYVCFLQFLVIFSDFSVCSRPGENQSSNSQHCYDECSKITGLTHDV